MDFHKNLSTLTYKNRTMSIRKLRRRNLFEEDMELTDYTLEQDEFKEPETWTIIMALNLLRTIDF